MSDLKTKMLDDMVSVFLNTSHFAENITYTPSGGSAKSIKALVIRQQLNPNSQDQNRTLGNTIEIYIAKDSTNGVATISRGLDKVSLPQTIGGSNVTWLVTDIIDHDDGSWHLMAQK